MPDVERRPRRGGGAHDDAGGNVGAIVTSPMRRRREASLRRGPFGDGPADPLDDLAGLPIPRRACARAVVGLDGRWRACCQRAAP